MKTARVYLPKKKLCESSGSYVKPAKNLFRSLATSIHEVYEDSDRIYADAFKRIEEIEDCTINALTEKDDGCYTAFTVCPFAGKHFIKINKTENGIFVTESGKILPSQKTENGYIAEIEAESLSAVSFRFEKTEETATVSPFAVNDNIIETPFYVIMLGNGGEISSVFDKENSREVLKGNSNVLEIFEDKPCDWDAWDIDIFYTQKCETPQIVSRRITENGEVCLTVGSVYKYNKSEIRQDMTLYSSSRRIDFKTEVNWNEKHRLLKAAFNVDVRSTKATYDIQFGHAERPTHFNTSWDYARFEVAAQKWMDISDSGYGVSILNDCKYGHSAKGNKISITLLKSAKFPDYAADMGMHEFTYSLLPHSGTAVSGETIKQASLLNMPPVTVNAKLTEVCKRIFKLDSENVAIDAVKKADNGDGVILRMHECKGGKATVKISSDYDFSEFIPCNLLEEPIGAPVCQSSISADFNPFEIKTFIVKGI